MIPVKALKEENNSILDGKSKLTNHNSDLESVQGSRRDKKEQDDLLMDSDDNELVKLGVDMS